MVDANPKLLSTQELASLAGVSLVTVNRQIRIGELRATKVASVWVVFENDANKWLASYEPQRREDG